MIAIKLNLFASLIVVLLLFNGCFVAAETSSSHNTRESKETLTVTTHESTETDFSTTAVSSTTSTHVTHITAPISTSATNNSKKKRPSKGDSADTPLDVEDVTWAWVPIVVLGAFTLFFLMTVKFRKLGFKSPRQVLAQYITVEGVCTSLGREFGSTHHEVEEQKKVEYGHQFFCTLGVIFLIVSKIFLVSDKRYVAEILVLAQIALFICNIILDVVLIRFGYLRPVRSVNTKLRFAHCCYQTFLFCTEILGSADDDTGFQLPPDVFIWASIHYCYESFGEILEGLNVTGLSEVVIVIYVNVSLIQSEYAPTGWALAFGLTSLSLSCASILGAMFWKVWAIRLDENHWDEKKHGHSSGSDSEEHEHHHEGGRHESPRASGRHEEGNASVHDVVLGSRNRLHASIGNDSAMTASMTTLVAAIINERQKSGQGGNASINATRTNLMRGEGPTTVSGSSPKSEDAKHTSNSFTSLNNESELTERLLSRSQPQPSPPLRNRPMKQRPPPMIIVSQATEMKPTQDKNSPREVSETAVAHSK